VIAGFRIRVLSLNPPALLKPSPQQFD